MACFDPQENVHVKAQEALGKSPQPALQPQQKHSLERLEPAIRKFIKISIPTDLERLEKHKINIDKYRKLQDWEKLNAEQINASRTVQQLKSTLREMELTMNQIREEDLQALDKKTGPIRKQAIAAIIAFIDSTKGADTDYHPLQTDQPPEKVDYHFEEPLPIQPQQKHSVKRLEPAIHKFIKIAIPTNLERLEKHRLNIDKYRKLQEWEKLNTEQINASRTVQQLKSTLHEMELAKSQIQEDDLRELNKRVGPIREQAIAAIIAFLDSTKGPSAEHPPPTNHTLDLAAQSPPLSADEDPVIQATPLPANGESPPPLLAPTPTSPDDGPQSTPPSTHGGGPESPPLPSASPGQGQQQIESPPSHQATLPPAQEGQLADQAQLQVQVEESWEKLKEDLIELNTMIHDFSVMVQDQQSKVDNILDNVETAQTHVEKGAFQLGMAAKVKAAMIPTAGAVIGGVIAGPIGLAAGLKVGALMAAVGGGAVGYGSGKLIKKKQDNANDMELQNLSSASRQPEEISTRAVTPDPDPADYPVNPDPNRGVDVQAAPEESSEGDGSNSWSSWKQWAATTAQTLFDDVEPGPEPDSKGGVADNGKAAEVDEGGPVAEEDGGKSGGGTSWSDWKLW